MCRRVHHRSDDLDELDDRSWPAMSKYDWQGIRVLRSHVNEVNPETVNLRPKPWQPIESALYTTPIVASAPVFNEGLCFGQRRTLGPIRYRFLVRPPSIGKSPFEIVQRCLRYMDLEGRYFLGRGREHDLCSPGGAPMGTYLHPRCQHTSATGCGGHAYELTARAEGRRFSCSVC